VVWSTEYRVRYVECDQQGVVFNAWYQTYMDDAVDCWMREYDPKFERFGWELMVKASNIVWHSPAGLGDTLALDLEVSRWGNTSFEMSVVGSVGDRHVFDGKLTYVTVDHTEHRPIPVPDELKSHLGS